MQYWIKKVSNTIQNKTLEEREGESENKKITNQSLEMEATDKNADQDNGNY